MRRIESDDVIDLRGSAGEACTGIDIELGFDQSNRHAVARPRANLPKSIQVDWLDELRSFL